MLHPQLVTHDETLMISYAQPSAVLREPALWIGNRPNTDVRHEIYL